MTRSLSPSHERSGARFLKESAEKEVPGTSVRLGISEEDLTSDNEWKNGSPFFLLL